MPNATVERSSRRSNGLQQFLLFHAFGLVIGMTLLLCGFRTLGQEAAPPVPVEELPPGSEVLTRGPVHEAFAKPVTMDPQSPAIVLREPPELLQELPPSEKPAGADVVWVPGYWAWDTDRNDYIWVSGCWRNAPPNTYWVPGYWMRSGTGWQWIAGFWKPFAQQSQEQIEYLPAPPPAIEVEAPGPPPIADQIWVPGCWYWVDGHYVRRHGYWITPRVGWVWIPSHYSWTSRGYVFCGGHWDYDLDNRGVLFTPAYFPPAVRIRAGFVFSPGICVDLGILRLNLFAYPRYNHYCFGDYYDDAYLRVGIYPWFRWQTVHTWYDPLFVYDRWHFRRSRPDWARHQEREFELRRTHRELRPAHTYTELRTQMERLPSNRRPERPLVEPLRTLASAPAEPVKFERVTPEERQRFASRATEIHNFRRQRDQWESPSSTTVAQPKSPTASQTAAPVPTQPQPPTDRQPAPSTTVQSQPPTETRRERPADVRRQPSREAKSTIPPSASPSPPVETRPAAPVPVQPQSPTETRPVVPTPQPQPSETRSTPPGSVRSQSARENRPTPPAAARSQPETERPSAPAVSPRPERPSETRSLPPSAVSPPTAPSRAETLPPKAQPHASPRAEPAQKRQEQRTAVPEVRVSRPEQVTVPPPALMPRPSESRSVGKQSPGPPAQERYRPETTPSSKSSSGRNPGNKGQREDSRGRDRNP